MKILLIRQDRVTCLQVKFTVQSRIRGLTLLEELHTICLTNPGFQYPSHALNTALTQFMGFPTIVVNPPKKYEYFYYVNDHFLQIIPITSQFDVIFVTYKPDTNSK